MRTIILSSLLLSVVLASALQTLDSEEDLKNTGFGLGEDHHGLPLLKWYVKTCLDNNMKALCDPVAGEYGFHPFENREKLLPDIGYFSIGNLNAHNAKNLPYDVKKNYKRNNRQSNEDRVLIKYDKNTRHISDIFISEHYENMYIIGPKLLAILIGHTPHVKRAGEKTQSHFPKLGRLRGHTVRDYRRRRPRSRSSDSG